jgi:hypothetical protein
MKERSIKAATGHVGTAALRWPVERSSTAFARKSIRLLAQQLKSSARTLIAALHEIFDESADARFLNQRQLESSREAYASFRQEYEVTNARRPRCC